MTHTSQFEDLPRAYPVLPISGDFRSVPEDFIVEEQLGFTASGEGEHAFLHIRKKGRNTEDIARLLARHAGITRKSVSYAGLKDRNAVTSQFFSVHLPGKQDPDWQLLADPALEFLSVNRHQKKLKRGALSRNDFCLIIRRLTGNREAAEQRLEQIKQQGVPNYFAAQRFGHNANNLVYAEQMLLTGKRVKDRFKRNIYYSAARSWLFNLVLAERICRENWNRAIAGDSMMLNGSRSCLQGRCHGNSRSGWIRKYCPQQLAWLDNRPGKSTDGSGSPGIAGICSRFVLGLACGRSAAAEVLTATG
jgi:tRNA pseudouridine13 synthase